MCVELADKKLEEGIYSVVYDSVPLPHTGTTHAITTHMDDEEDTDAAETSNEYATVMELQQTPWESSNTTAIGSPSESPVYSDVLIPPKPYDLRSSTSSTSATQLPQTTSPSSHLVLEAQVTASKQHTSLEKTCLLYTSPSPRDS